MNVTKPKFVYFLVGVALCLFQQLAFCQIPDFNKVRSLHPGDSASIVSLINGGIKKSKGSVIAWFPKDSLSQNRMKEITDTLYMGILAAEKFINAPRSWQWQQKGDPYTYYFRTGNFVSHGSNAGFVSIPFWRIKEGKAPWLHEAMHEMLASKPAYPVTNEEWGKYVADHWLMEGLPEYIARQVSQLNNFPMIDPFNDSIPQNDIDKNCKESLRNERSEYILSFIGKQAVMKELNGKDRFLYSSTFYKCSCSFVKYLVDQAGLEAVLTGFSKFPREHEGLEKLMPSSLELMKKLWLEKLRND